VGIGERVREDGLAPRVRALDRGGVRIEQELVGVVPQALRGAPRPVHPDSVAPFDPREIIAAAQLRRPAGRPEVEPVRVDQALSAAAALEGYTSEYWRSVGETGGTIAVGSVADLTVFAHDPLTTAPDVFATSPVLLTVVGGEVVVEAISVV
ncbi:amidohydrolase family protein, partial [Rhizobium johnstonii]|uniref:amidohydrolase family protein n=1 Tax=Rhizobium johnstonii TaxID=3019933 RepID=UPI003F9974D7